MAKAQDLNSAQFEEEKDTAIEQIPLRITRKSETSDMEINHNIQNLKQKNSDLLTKINDLDVELKRNLKENNFLADQVTNYSRELSICQLQLENSKEDSYLLRKELQAVNQQLTLGMEEIVLKEKKSKELV